MARLTASAAGVTVWATVEIAARFGLPTGRTGLEAAWDGAVGLAPGMRSLRALPGSPPLTAFF
jgi:hypothetical protein